MNFSVLVLLLVTLVWGTTFPIIRVASVHLGGVEITALRFLVAGICMLPFAFKGLPHRLVGRPVTGLFGAHFLSDAGGSAGSKNCPALPATE